MPKDKQRVGLQKNFAAIFDGVWVPKKPNTKRPHDALTAQEYQQQTAEIEQIIGSMKCAKNFECFKSGFQTLCKVKNIGNGKIIECSPENHHSCEFRFSFTRKTFCKCPLRYYIAKNLNKSTLGEKPPSAPGLMDRRGNRLGNQLHIRLARYKPLRLHFTRPFVAIDLTANFVLKFRYSSSLKWVSHLRSTTRPQLFLIQIPQELGRIFSQYHPENPSSDLLRFPGTTHRLPWPRNFNAVLDPKFTIGRSPNLL